MSFLDVMTFDPTLTKYISTVYGCQSSVLSNSMVYISTSFIFQVSYSYISGFATTTKHTLVVSPRDYQLRHLAVIPLRLCLVHQRPD